ncbi:MAG TPA: STAS domain-containing protein [Steroidobacteraceae bacterium]|nr:STAS domain-containing protein [Steroidobacteraceae bacterium]
MPRGARAKPRRASVKLQADCTLRQATSLKSSLLGLKPGAQGATLDGSAVQRIDTAGLQLLAAFAQGEAKAGRPLAWAGASPVLQDAGRRLGLAAVLSLPAGADAPP